MKNENKLTKTEANALEFSNKLWGAIIQMEKECKIHPDDIHDFRKDVNAIQNRIMSRLAVRLHPDLFHVHNEKVEEVKNELNKIIKLLDGNDSNENIIWHKLNTLRKSLIDENNG